MAKLTLKQRAVGKAEVSLYILRGSFVKLRLAWVYGKGQLYKAKVSLCEVKVKGQVCKAEVSLYV